VNSVIKHTCINVSAILILPPLYGCGSTPHPDAYWAITILSGIVLLLTWLTFYLYRWRKQITGDKEIVVPEKFWSEYQTQKKKLTHIQDFLAKSATVTDANIVSMAAYMEETKGKLLGGMANQEQSIEDLSATFMALQTALDARDTEIKRHKAGYDQKIFRNFLNRFIRVDCTLSEFISDQEYTQESFEDLQSLLTDALEECGVERFLPTIGDDYRSAEGVADNPRLVSPRCAEDAYKIIEILEPGYWQHTDDARVIIRAAKVRVYGPFDEPKPAEVQASNEPPIAASTGNLNDGDPQSPAKEHENTHMTET
jgi:hypothetical protein